ncbi:MAG: Gfo/Idh/MocA family oxidoreductase [Candidatus Aminicenantes bacterium]|nr:MAG: Gfo/Idh/MocA family oxidoreductase [Candidatus Aminicenantes bacterium]
MNGKIRIGVIGTGAMGRNHLRVLSAIPGFQLSCAADINEENLHAACEPYSIKKLKDYREMVSEVDAVMVSTPTIYHHEIARYFLENKKHVMVEKPITTTVEHADQLIRLAEKNRVILAVGFPERFNPAVAYIKSLVKKPLFIEVQRLGPFSPRSLDVDVIMDLMIHDLDIILQWDDTGVNQINASGVPIISDKIDIANVRLQFNSKLVVNVTASRVSQKKTRKLRIFQRNNYISLDYKKKRVKTFALSKGEILEDRPVIEDVEPLYMMWLNFYKTLTTGENHHVTGLEARNALELAIRISERIKKNMEEQRFDD